MSLLTSLIFHYSRLSTIFILTCSLLISSTICKIVATVEAPTVQTSTLDWKFWGTKTFDEVPLGKHRTYDTSFGPIEYGMDGTFTNLLIHRNDVYGGVYVNGKFATCVAGDSYELKLKATKDEKPNCIGMWLSAFDPWSKLQFHFLDGEIVNWGYEDLVALIGNNRAYYGNPNYPEPRPNSGQLYVYVNFKLYGQLDKIKFIEESEGGGLEIDQIMMGVVNPPPVIPPATETTTTTTTTTTTEAEKTQAATEEGETEAEITEEEITEAATTEAAATEAATTEAEITEAGTE